MKRLNEDLPERDDTRDCGPLKRVKRTELFQACEKELAFFRSLWPYEKQRWLYACLGLCAGGLQRDVVRTILVDWMHLQCVSRTGYRLVPPLTERIYDPWEAPVLFAAMRQLERESMLNKVETERAALLAKGVPNHNLCLIHANFPYDGSGAIFDYKPDWLDTHGWHDNVHIPPYLDYTCVDVNDTDAIRQRIDRYTWSDEKMSHWRMKRKAKRKMSDAKGQAKIEQYIAQGGDQ